MSDIDIVRDLIKGAMGDLETAVRVRADTSGESKPNDVLVPMFEALAKVWAAVEELADWTQKVSPLAALRKFAEGTGGVRPQAHVSGAAERIVQEALENGLVPNAKVAAQGDLWIQVEFANGRVLDAVLRMNGGMSGGLYLPDRSVVKYWRDASEGEVWGIVHALGSLEDEPE